MSDQIEQVELIIQHMGEAVIATTDTVESLAQKMNAISEIVEQQEHQIQQQGYQIFALTEAIQTLVDSQAESREQLNQLTDIIKTLVITLKSSH